MKRASAITALVLFAACRGGAPVSHEGHTPERPAVDQRQISGGVTCPRPGLQAFSGVVERAGDNFVLRADGRAIPVWAISQQEMVAPTSPDLSARVGQTTTICGQFDGAALYEAVLVEEP